MPEAVARSHDVGVLPAEVATVGAGGVAAGWDAGADGASSSDGSLAGAASPAVASEDAACSSVGFCFGATID